MTNPVDVVGSQPLSFTNTNGEQMVVPLSALEFSGGQPQLKTTWATAVPLLAGSETVINKLAQALAAAGALTPPPTPPPAPALAFTAAHTGPETNGITVGATTTPGTGGPLTTQITITATETDTWSGLGSGDNAAQTIGVDKLPTATGDPHAGTGLIVVVSGSQGPGIAAASKGTLQQGKTADLLESDGQTKVCTIAPRADYTGTAPLNYTVAPDASGMTFAVTASYDSGAGSPITVLTLSSLPAPVAYLVTASAPPTGAVVPANNSSVQLSGGATGIAAAGLLYA